jgi:hypothetical protein
MASIRKAVYTRMANDATLTAMLATFTDRSNVTRPAIFTGPRVPEKAQRPYIWTYANVSDTDDSTKVERGRDIFRDISVIVDNDGSPEPLDSIANRVQVLFDRHELAIDDAVTVVADVSGPVPAEVSEDLQGLMLTLRLRIESE